MKHNIFKSLLIFTLTFILASTVFAQNTLSDFSQLTLRDNINLEIIQGNTNSYIIEPAEATPYILMKITEEELLISKNEVWNKKVLVKLTFKSLNSITLIGSGDITSTSKVKAENIKLNLTGSGDIKLDLTCNDLEVNVAGSGDINLSGKANSMNTKIAGSGDLNAKDLVTDKANVSIAGSGGAIVNVQKELNAKVSGSGDIHYIGNPETKNIDIIGSGTIQQTSSDFILKQRESGSTENVKNDTTKLSLGDKKIMIINEDDDKKKSKHKKDIQHVWAGVELGLNAYSNHSGATTLPGSSYYTLNYLKSTVVNINPFERNFKIYKNYLAFTTGLGFQFNRFMFEKDITMLPFKDSIQTVPANNVFKKNMLKASYLTLPLLFQINTNENHKKSFHFAFGGQFGLRLGSRTKQVWYVEGDKKRIVTRSEYNLNLLQYGVTARIGFGALNIFANYNLSSLFKRDKGPELYPFQIGVTLMAF